MYIITYIGHKIDSDYIDPLQIPSKAHVQVHFNSVYDTVKHTANQLHILFIYITVWWRFGGVFINEFHQVVEEEWKYFLVIDGNLVG